MPRTTFLVWSLPLALLLGCEGDNTPDANTQVFQTIQEVAEQRKAQQETIWKGVAVDVLKVDRPDVAATPGEGFSLLLAADGVSHAIDLAPAWDLLIAQPDRSTQILRNHMAQELPAFDRQRLLALSPDRARAMVRPVLVTGAELGSPTDERNALPRSVVSADLYWVPAIHWPTGAKTPVTQHALATWNLDPAAINAAALDNLRSDLNRSPDELFETTRFGPTGRVGTLRPEAEPAFILLPEFLAKVRAAWEMSDDLAILPVTRQNIRFLESRNRTLLDLVSPGWKEQVETTPGALSRRVLLLSERGLGVMDYTPPVRITTITTQPVPGLGGRGAPQMGQPRIGPASRPPIPTTRPAIPQRPGQQNRPYIVR